MLEGGALQGEPLHPKVQPKVLLKVEQNLELFQNQVALQAQKVQQEVVPQGGLVAVYLGEALGICQL